MYWLFKEKPKKQNKTKTKKKKKILNDKREIYHVKRRRQKDNTLVVDIKTINLRSGLSDLIKLENEKVGTHDFKLVKWRSFFFSGIQE